MKKLTKMNKFEMVMEILASVEVENKEMLVEFVQHEMSLLAKKNTTTGERKPSKAQLENLVLIEKIEFILEDGIARTISDIIKEEQAFFGEMSNQKMSALLKKLVDGGKATKFVEKKKTYFQIKNEQ